MTSFKDTRKITLSLLGVMTLGLIGFAGAAEARPLHPRERAAIRAAAMRERMAIKRARARARAAIRRAAIKRKLRKRMARRAALRRSYRHYR